MNFYCTLCDKSMTNKSTNGNFKIKPHKTLDISIIRWYIILNPNFEEIGKKQSSDKLLSTMKSIDYLELIMY